MISDFCFLCGTVVLIPETSEDNNNPNSIKYWSYDNDGKIQPYCSPECSLKMHERNHKKK